MQSAKVIFKTNAQVSESETESTAEDTLSEEELEMLKDQELIQNEKVLEMQNKVVINKAKNEINQIDDTLAKVKALMAGISDYHERYQVVQAKLLDTACDDICVQLGCEKEYRDAKKAAAAGKA